MTASLIPIAIVLPPLLAALLITLLALRRPALARALLLAALLISVVASAAALWRCALGETLTYQFGGWPAPYGIVYGIDTLAALASLLITSIGLAATVYAGPSLAREAAGNEGAFLATSALLLSGMIGMVITADLFNLYVFLEIAAITAYTLIAAGGGTAALASFRYLLIGTVGASFYLLGLAYLFALTGTLNMSDMAARLPAFAAQPAVITAIAFIVTGFAVKMAVFPMHGWLPDAYTYAPTVATALIGALMTKVSAFALLRVLYGVAWPAVAPLDLPITSLLGWPAAIGVLVGSVMALAQTDVKRLLAYSSISHVGYIALGLAIGNSDALVGAVLHIVAHSLMKGCLFLIVGGVSYRFGIRVEEGFQHLARKMPVAMAAFVLCALSMMGIPPTIGFFSKWYLLLGALRAGEIGFVVILLVSTLLNAWYFFRLIERIYFGHEEEEGGRPATERELPPSMLGPIAVLASALIVVGTLSYPLADGLLRRPVDSFVGTLERSLEVTFEPSHEWGGRGTRERANVQTLERSLVWKQWSR